MVSSAVYRYFPSRDELLTRLISDSYAEVADTIEQQVIATAGRSASRRLAAIADSVRSWALGSPHSYALIYGTPIPGYVAPPATARVAERIAVSLFEVVAGAGDESALRTDEAIETSRQVRADLARLRSFGAGLDDATLVRALAWWTEVLGHISFELFGQFHNVIDDLDGFFTLQVHRATERLLHGLPSSPLSDQPRKRAR